MQPLARGHLLILRGIINYVSEILGLWLAMVDWRVKVHSDVIAISDAIIGRVNFGMVLFEKKNEIRVFLPNSGLIFRYSGVILCLRKESKEIFTKSIWRGLHSAITNFPEYLISKKKLQKMFHILTKSLSLFRGCTLQRESTSVKKSRH